MRLVFLGTPQFAVPSLERILAEGHEVQAVYHAAGPAKGRGRELGASPVKQFCACRGLGRAPTGTRPQAGSGAGTRRPGAGSHGRGGLRPDHSQSILDIPPAGHRQRACLAASEVSRRGARAVGDRPGRARNRRYDDEDRRGLDTGDILLGPAHAHRPEETATELAVRLSAAGADLLAQTLAGIRAGAIAPHPQDNSLASHAPSCRKEDGLIDWKSDGPGSLQ